MAPEPLQSRLAEPGPKRILALDGGGIRGLVTIGFLARIEQVLRERHDRADLVLSDYFDLVGGTSTGSIIATFVALGFPVERIRELYLTLGRNTFTPKRSWLGPVARIMAAKFDERPVIELLRQSFGDITLDSERLKIGLCVVAKRADTGSVWVLVNLPDNRFYESNRKFKLWQVIRASTAAPMYFKPEWIDDVGDGTPGVFVDGGVSMHLNPALQLLMVSNLEGFGLQWPMGANNIQVTSIGTGAFDKRPTLKALRRFTQLHWLGLLLVQMMKDSSELNQTILQWMSQSHTAQHIDLQLGDLGADQMGPAPLITYQRYNVQLSKAGLAEVGMEISTQDLMRLRDMSDVTQIERLDELGGLAAEAIVSADHFPERFDRRIPEVGLT